MRRPAHGPTPAATQVEETLIKMGVPGVAASLRIRRQWPDLVSEEWRAKARPLVLEDGRLVVEVVSGMDATLLRYGTAGLVEQLNTALGSRVVTHIALRVARSSRGT